MHHSFAVALIIALTGFAQGTPASDAAVFLSKYTWSIDTDWFGGWSSLELSDDGQTALILQDKGYMLNARILREDDKIIGVEADAPKRLRSVKGGRLSMPAADAEGLALVDGGFCVSFECYPRLACYGSINGNATLLPRPPGHKKLHANRAYEALAVAPDGSLWTLAETTVRDTADVLRWNGASWDIIATLDAFDGFKPVGADFGPDGQFYLLERRFGLLGFKSRLRRWTANALDVPGEVLFTSARFEHGNLEGISIWRDAQQRLIATMVSDNNFFLIQRTEIVEYALPD